jgi:hypothetical protein
MRATRQEARRRRSWQSSDTSTNPHETEAVATSLSCATCFGWASPGKRFGRSSPVAASSDRTEEPISTLRSPTQKSAFLTDSLQVEYWH